MFIMVMTNTRENIFQGDAEDYLAMQDYDEEVTEILNFLESPKNPYIVKYTDLIIMRCKDENY